MTDLIKQPKDIETLDDFKFRKTVEPQLFDILGMIEAVSVVPTGKPTKFQQQFKIYNASGTRRFYWYDQLNDEWVYTAGTV